MGAGAVSEPRGRRRDDPKRSTIRIAAVGDFHCGEGDGGKFRARFARANQEADVLVLAGDLTNLGTPGEMRAVTDALADVRIPIVAVLGNHDHETGHADEARDILCEAGVHLLDGDSWTWNGQVGFAGIKGFIGGFGRYALTAFGEAGIKDLVGSTLDDVKRLESALSHLDAPTRVAVLHYAPVAATVTGEPEQIWAFLGTDRLAEPLDRYDVAVCFHGHAHIGAFQGATPGGCPVYNVALPVLAKSGIEDLYYLHKIPLEDAEEPVASLSSQESA